MHRTAITAAICALVALVALPVFGQPAMSATSVMDWHTEQIDSIITMDTQKAGITLPTGRNAAYRRLDMELPSLLKDTFFSVLVDSSSRLGDIVEAGSVSLQDLDAILEAGTKTPPTFSRDLSTLSLNHTVSVALVGSLFIKHSKPRSPDVPLETVATRPWTGIVIDARGALPVRGEYVTERLRPSLFPKVWDESMNLAYEKNMVDPEVARARGIAHFASSLEQADQMVLVGDDPLHIVARGVFGINRTDPVLSRSDALKILCIPENRKLLLEGRVVIVCDSEALKPGALGPDKDEQYYFVRNEIERKLRVSPVTGMDFSDAWQGLKLTIYDVRFVADTANILPDERNRLDVIAAALAMAGERARFLVEGHTASVGKPAGELELSLLRARTIAAEIVKRGIPADRITVDGHGGTKPLADNDSEEGRALNRRVEITIDLDDGTER